MAVTIFLKLGTMIDNVKGKKETEPDYQKKIGSSKKLENVVKMAVFWLFFLKNVSNDFDETWSECRTNQYWTARKNRMSKKIAVLEIFIHKVQILAKNGKSGV